jgi:type IV secretory pathway VirB10-like protein
MSANEDLNDQEAVLPKKKGFMGVTIHMTAGRWLMVGVGSLALLTAFGVAWVEGRNAQVDEGAQVNAQNNGAMTNAPGKSSPAYAAEVNAYNKKHADEALRHNKSFVGIPVTSVTSVAMSSQSSIDEQQPISYQTPIQETPQMQQPQQPQQPAADESIAKEFGSIAVAMKNQRMVNPGYYVPQVQVSEQPVAFAPASGTASSSGGTADASGAQVSKPVIRPGSIIYGVFENAMKSTMPGPVIGELVQGAYNGDRVIGSFTKASGSNKLLIRMKTLVLPSGKTIPINAYAVSPRTTLPGMATNVNYHLLTRAANFFGAAFIAGVEGYGSAISQEGTTTVDSALGGSTQAYPILTPAQTLDIAAGKAAQQLEPLSQEMEQKVMEPNTVSIAPGTPFGLLVVSSGASAASMPVTGASASTAGKTVPDIAPQPQGAQSAAFPGIGQPS